MERLEAVEAKAPAGGALDSAESGPGLAALHAELTAAGRGHRAEPLARVVAWLESAPASEAHAKALLALLDADAFAETTDAEGRPLKALALLALLRFGYPWALQVKPEDLAWLREVQRSAWRKYNKIIALVLLLLLALKVVVVTHG